MGENGEEDDEQETNTRADVRPYLNLSGPMKAHLSVETAKPANTAAKHSYFLRAKGPPRSSPSINKDSVSDEERRPVNGPSDHNRPSPTEEEDLIASCLVMLSKKPNDQSGPRQPGEKGAEAAFQCKACKKMFASHQALGGHRASHKKVKGCFAASPPEDEEIAAGEDLGPAEDGPARPVKRTKMHECLVCRRVFASGQALGGHKRCHWLTTPIESGAFVPSFEGLGYDHRNGVFLHAAECDRQLLDLNLNLPVSKIEGQDGSEMNKLKRLRDLRDVKYGDGWLQMGITSTAEF